MKTFRDLLEAKKSTWTTKVGGGAKKDWSIKKTWIDSTGDVFIEFKTPVGPFNTRIGGKAVTSAASGALGWSIKKSWIDKNGDVFITFNTKE